METPRYTLKKEERISSKKSIDQLFSGKATTITSFPLRAICLFVEKEEAEASVSILVSVPKKKFKRAVKRNRIKRQIREAYRLNKDELVREVEFKNKKLLIAFIYLDNKLYSSSLMEQNVKLLVGKVINKLKTQEL